MIYADPGVWEGFEPGVVTLASPDPQAFRPQGEAKNVLEVGLPTNFKTARFESNEHTAILRNLEADINAIAQAATPVYDRLMASCPQALLKASGIEVGLPRGQMGNSEVGHLNLGAGRIVDQVIRRIDAAMEDGALAANPAVAKLVGRLRGSGGTCHLLSRSMA